jgi:type I restriction enzyme S subunit
MQGANLPRLSPGSFLDIPIYLPPVNEQRRIVALLDEADELRRLRQRADRRTADLIPALFHEMFGDPVTNPLSWKTSAVGALFPTDRAGARCGPFGSALKKEEYVEGGIPVWGIENVRPNLFVEAGALFITEEKYRQLANYRVEPGDILISRAGTVGRMCVATPPKSPSIIGTNLIRLALDRSVIEPEYFTALFTHFGHQIGRLRADADTGAYSFMNTSVLRSLEIPVPPLPVQKLFAARVTDIRALQARQAEGRRLDDLFQSMLHRAFQGEL